MTMRSIRREAAEVCFVTPVTMTFPATQTDQCSLCGAKDETSPDYRVVILGAGRNTRGGMPSAMTSIGRNDCVLDWLLSAFSSLPNREVTLVSGFMADVLTDRCDDVRLVHNARWETTGPVTSLSLAVLPATRSTFVSYSDVVFRPETVQRLEAHRGDLVIAVDRSWKVRYDGRSRSEMDQAEKIICTNGRLVDIGRHIPTADATAEFAGLLKLSPGTSTRLQKLIKSGVLGERDGLPEVLRFLIQHGVVTTVLDVDGQWAELNAPQDLARFVLGTKAESLERLKPLIQKGVIGELVSFTHDDWNTRRAVVLDRVQQVFGEASVIVRSSALSEDSWQQSLAGAHESVADVPAGDTKALAAAIDAVWSSYAEALPENQVLIQEMLRDVSMSGVVMTRTPALGSPYYVINYDDTTDRTDTVTSGAGASLQTLFMHRDAALRPGLPGELYHLVDVVKELESVVGHDCLDIEFAFTRDGVAHVLQVRPIAVAHLDQPVDDLRISEGLKNATCFFRDLQKASPFVVGRSTQLSVMSDWNPAEIIGTKPGRLAFSLYRHLITDETWAVQRAEYGYRDVRPCPLLVDILGHPYVDVRATFNSFVPASLPEHLADCLVEYYLDCLAQHPELHDKVEFDILLTCLTFDFEQRVRALSKVGFSDGDIDQLRTSLRDITRHGIARCERDLAGLTSAQRRFDHICLSDVPSLDRAFLFLEDARLHAVPLFAHLARGAFVAMSLLRSLEAVGAITSRQADAFLASVRTVSGEMQADAEAVAGGHMPWVDFVVKYGHLRPGTYDITSPHYGQAPEEYLRPVVLSAGRSHEHQKTNDPVWDAATRQAITGQLHRMDLGIAVDGLERFMRQAVAGREYAKFVFTRNLSQALEALADFGEEHSISRDELAQIRIQDLFSLRSAGVEQVGCRLKKMAIEGQEAAYVTQSVCLPGQIVSEQDLVCFQQLKAQPNFITRERIRGGVFPLSRKTPPETDLTGKIVLTPNADPGFDWVFSRGIAGLVTMYGGVNSHMAVRAGEFGLPAVTGIGELLYERLSKAEIIELDCGSRQIRVVR